MISLRKMCQLILTISNYKKYNPLKNAMTPFFNNEIKPDRRKEGEALKQRAEEERIRREYPKVDLLTNERKMAFCMVYLLYQLQEVIFYDGKTKRTNPDGNP